MGFDIAKLGVGVVASLGGSAVANVILKGLMPANLSKFDKVFYKAGQLFIGCAVGTACARESDRIFDTIGSLFGRNESESYEA